ncbi:uncharacterized protein [Ptychodera flava]|uniref:uncharacterized protein n=1 Tax=Ptychodera flava TaxID=63121 RepID=UPI003969F271
MLYGRNLSEEEDICRQHISQLSDHIIYNNHRATYLDQDSLIATSSSKTTEDNMYSRSFAVAVLLAVTLCIHSSQAVNICKTRAGRKFKSCQKSRPGKRGEESVITNAIYALLETAVNVVQEMDQSELNQLLLDAAESSSEETDNEVPEFEENEAGF